MTAWKDKTHIILTKLVPEIWFQPPKTITPPLIRALVHDWDNHTVHMTELCAKNTVALSVFLCSFLFPKITRYYLGKTPGGISESILW